jgi:hypothetical protein
MDRMYDTRESSRQRQRPWHTPGPCEDGMEIGCQSGFRSLGESDVVRVGRPAGYVVGDVVCWNDVRLCVTMLL